MRPNTRRRRTSAVISVSLSPELLAIAEKLAREERRTRSELVREAIRQYATTRRWRQLRRWGEAAARLAGVRDDGDIERVVAEERRLGA